MRRSLMASAVVPMLLLAAAVNAQAFHGTDRKIMFEMPEDGAGEEYTIEQLQSGAFMNMGTASRVVNGDDVDRIWKAPYVASLWGDRTDSGNYSFRCSASVVHKNIIMTAAHCITASIPYLVCVSAVDLRKGLCFSVTDLRVPSQFLNSDRHTHDIGLVKVDGNLLAGNSKAKVVPVDLARTNIKANGQLGYFFGFGAQNNQGTEFDGLLKTLDVRWKKFALCASDANLIEKNFLCMDGNYDGSLGVGCFGDSGGPLVWSKDDSPRAAQHVQVAVQSFVYPDSDLGSKSCDAEAPMGASWTAAWQITRFLKRAMKELGGSFIVYNG